MNDTQLENVLDQVRKQYQPTPEDQERVYHSVVSTSAALLASQGVSTFTKLKLATGASVILAGLVGGYLYFGTAAKTVTNESTSHELVPAVSTQIEALQKPLSEKEIGAVSSDVSPVDEGQPVSVDAHAIAPAQERIADTKKKVSPHYKTSTAALTRNRNEQVATEQKDAKDVKNNDSTIVEELKLISAASRAINQDDTLQATKLLREHQQRFPNGVMTKERQGLKIISLCKSGDMESAGRRYENFKLHSASAPIAIRIEKICRFE